MLEKVIDAVPQPEGLVLFHKELLFSSVIEHSESLSTLHVGKGKH